MFIFDLDGTVINSHHRTAAARKAGIFCLQTYIKECNTPDLIAKDTLLPLAQFMQSLASKGEKYAIITARYCGDADRQFLQDNGLVNHNTILLGRDSVHKSVSRLSDADYKRYQLNRLKRIYGSDDLMMFEDIPEVISAMRGEGIVCVDAKHLNLQLRDLGKASSSPVSKVLNEAGDPMLKLCSLLTLAKGV